MFEVVGAFLAGVFLNWYALGILCAAGVWFEHSDTGGFSVFLAIVTAVVAALFFSVPLTDILVYAAAFVAIGFIWSFWRYRRYVVGQVEYIRKNISGADRRQSEMERLAPKYHTDKIVAWVVVWPFSAIESITGDLIEGITKLVKTTFKAIYNKIYTSATAGLVD
jgi:hypothetical protein